MGDATVADVLVPASPGVVVGIALLSAWVIVTVRARKKRCLHAFDGVERTVHNKSCVAG